MELRRVLRSKIHRAVVTEADLEYEGSITIPPLLLNTAEIAEFEAVWVWNVTNGARFETYTIAGDSDSNDICVNGAAAHLVNPGDIVIIASFSWVPAEQLAAHRPKVVFVDRTNRPREIGDEIAGPAMVARSLGVMP